MAGIPRYRIEGLNSELEKLNGDLFGKLSALANGFHQDETNKVFSRLIPDNIRGIDSDINYYYLGKIYSSSNPPTEILASHASEYYNDGNNNMPSYLDQIQFQYRTYSGDPSASGNWTDGYTNDLNVPVSGYIDPATGTYDYEVQVGIPTECSRVYWKPSGLNVWTTMTNLNSSRGSLAGFNTRGFGYAVGGETFPKSNVVEKYDDSTNIWSIMETISVAKASLSGFGLNGFGYAAGGTTGSDSDVVEKYNDLSNSWSTVETLTLARYGLAGFNLNGFGYTVGGIYGASFYTSHSEKYNDTTNTWSNITFLGTARGRVSGFALNEFGYSAGGTTGSNSDVVEKYNDNTNSWSTMTILNTARNGLVGFDLNSFGYVAGGYNGGYLDLVEKYNDLTDSWDTVTALGTARMGSAGFNLNEFGYVAGGIIGTYTGTTVTEKYSDLAQNWPKIKGFTIKITE